MVLWQVFLVLAVTTVIAHVVILILIMAELDRRGYKTNILLARIYTFKYLSAYKETTRKETGKVGPLYGLWILTINLTLVFALAGFLSK